MWSNPAPPSASGMAKLVNPSSPALRKFSRGNRPVSSSSLAMGFTSDSANSRTLFWRSLCSSLSSRFTAALRDLASSLCEGLAQPFVGGLQLFRMHAGLGGDGHEVCVTEPARQRVHVQVSGDSCAGGAAKIHAQVHSVRLVYRPIGTLHTLRKSHHFGKRIRVAC